MRSCETRLIHVLEDSRRAHTAADAHRDHAVLAAAPFHLVDDLHGEFRAGATQGVSEGTPNLTMPPIAPAAM